MSRRKGPVQHGWRRGEPLEAMITREWLVTNGMGGYASGTIGGACTRRFHGLLIAALPTPWARTMMFNHLEEWLSLTDGRTLHLSADEHAGGKEVSFPEQDLLEEFVLERGTPVWRFAKDGLRLEKRLVMPHLQNTTYVVYRLLEGPPGIVLNLRPALHFRPHEGLLTKDDHQWRVELCENGIEISDQSEYPPLRLVLLGADARLERDETLMSHVLYRIEKSRGYDNEGPLWSPGVIRIPLAKGQDCGFVASVERWEIINALTADEAFATEDLRRARLIEMAGSTADDEFAAQLVLAADQFLIHPSTRIADEARAHAAGESPRTVIAGYHWFTDWGRDTMISLEGLTLVTGRRREAGRILRTFASYVRDGLIPNMFPEGQQAGLYHTADASMWFFHALHRYVQYTHDLDTVEALLPKLLEIIECHVTGTRFNIHVDPADGLLVQGEEGYQLTWMDAKVDGWVVTPRRGKAVEINALFYNALRIVERFLSQIGDTARASTMAERAQRVRQSFNSRFWNDDGQYLYDIVDAQGGGNDAAIRPNQIFAVSLDFPVLDEARWERIVDVVEKELLTPVGLRSLSRDHSDYKKAYDGDLRSRDAAYHQGTVWGWLIGPFIDAWLRVHPDRRDEAMRFLKPFRDHLSDACIGTISEIFDAEGPYHPRGCAAQAWSVAEVLRCLQLLRRTPQESGSPDPQSTAVPAGDR